MMVLHETISRRHAIDINNNITQMRKTISFRKSGVTVESISVCNAIENFMEHGIHCLPCSYTNAL